MPLWRAGAYRHPKRANVGDSWLNQRVGARNHTGGLAFDPQTPGAEPNAQVAPGKVAKAVVELLADGTMVGTAKPKSPARCVLTATVVGPVSPDLEPMNDTSEFVVDLVDKNDL
ncbi:MAG: hypothetical protein N3C12_06345 [Candidatus Binatia bacterium]|nr:hypothetical protein [Candidatus Binatia bacterium]